MHSPSTIRHRVCRGGSWESIGFRVRTGCLTKTASLDGRQYDIAVGQIDVGNAATPMAMKMAKGVPQANLEIKAEPLMDVALVGSSVVYMASLPLEANVMFHTVMATKMPFAGRG